MSAGAERIIEHILDDAKAKAAEIKAEAALKSREAAGEAQKEAVRRQEQILARARDEAAERKRRILGAAQLDARKDKLAVKQELIAAAFKQSLEELCAVDDRSYSSILQRKMCIRDRGRVSASPGGDRGYKKSADAADRGSRRKRGFF